MGKLASIEKALKKLSQVNELEKLIISAAKPFEAEMIDFNTSNLERGKLSDGSDTQEYASLPYTNFKSSIGSQSVPNMDYKVSGKFYKGWFIKFKASSLFMGSNDKKAASSESRFGNEIYGLQKKDKRSTGILLTTGFIKSFRNAFK